MTKVNTTPVRKQLSSADLFDFNSRINEINPHSQHRFHNDLQGVIKLIPLVTLRK